MERAEERLRLSESQPLVGGHPSLPPGSEISLQAIIEVSYAALEADPAAQQVLYALSLMAQKPDSLSEKTALAVSRCLPASLDILVNHGLLEVTDAERYTVHQTTTDFMRLTHPDSQVGRQIVKHFVAAVQSTLRSPAERRELAPNVLRALELAEMQEDGLSDALVLAGEAGNCWYESDTYAEGRRRLEGIISKVGNYQKQSVAYANALHWAGVFATLLGDPTAALKRLQGSLSILENQDKPLLVAASLKAIGNTHASVGHFEQACEYHQRSVGIYRQVLDHPQISDRVQIRQALATSLNNLGNFLVGLEEYEQAGEAFEECLVLRREFPEDESGLAQILNNLVLFQQ